MIEEPANDQAGGDANEDLASRSWYLAALGWNLLWIHTRGARTSSDGDPISHMGRELISYPSLRCHVFLRNAWPWDDPVAPEWIRQDNLQGNSVFVGINFPFFLEPPENSEAAAADTDEVLPVFKPYCVFATHLRGQHRP